MDTERTSPSALVRRLREAGRAKPRSFGFARGEEVDSKPRPTMLLMVEVEGLDSAAASIAIKNGAAAILFRADAAAIKALDGNDSKAFATAAKACGDAVPGVLLPSGTTLSQEAAKSLQEAGFDFVFFAADEAPAQLLAVDKIARVARASAGLATGLLRALGELRVDVVAVEPLGTGDQLMVTDLIAYRHVADALHQPMLIIASAVTSPADLQALRDVGAEAVLLPLSLADRATEYRDAIEAVKIHRQGDRRGDIPVVLPRPSGSGGEDQGGDEDDE